MPKSIGITKKSIMIVSNFELLIKRIATVPNTVPSAISSVFRRVVQGYFLTVSNLETDRTVSLYLTLTIPTSVGNRVMDSSNTQIVFDNGNTDNDTLTLTRSSLSNPDFVTYYTSGFSLRPQQTGLIAVLPNVTPFIGQTDPDLEIRGFVKIKQRSSIFRATPEADILITPETRGTFLDNDYPTTVTSNELDFDQISYGLTTANGKSENTVERVPPIIIRPNAVTNDFAKLKAVIRKDNPDLTDEELEMFSNNLMGMKENKDIQKLFATINK